MEKGDAAAGFLFLILVIVAVIGIWFYYNNFLKETVTVEKNTTYIPKYVDLAFSFGKEGKLETRYIDLRKNEYGFSFSLMNSFDRKINVKICPSISLEMIEGNSTIYYDIKTSCKNFKIDSGKSDGGDFSIPINGEDKKKLCNATKINLNISIENDGTIKSLAELVISQGYPTHQISKSSFLEVKPILEPNPIDLKEHKEFSLSISVRKFAKKLTIDKIDVRPIETKITTKRGAYEREETIGIDGSFSLEEKHEILLPDERINLKTLPAPYIKVNEEGKITSLPLNCDSEVAKKLKVCELKKDEKVSESFKRMYIEIDVFFTSSREIIEKLFIDQTQCS